MLDKDAARLTRNRIKLEIAEQHGRISADINRGKRGAVASGNARSGAFIHFVVNTCSRAAIERAELAWQVLHRIVSTAGVAYYDGLADDLKGFILEFFPEELVDLNVYVIQETQFATNETMVNELKGAIGAARATAVARAEGEIDLYVLSLKNRQAPADKPTGTTVHVYSAVGAIQTGAGAVANITQNLDMASKAALLDVLARVEGSLARIESLSPQTKGDVTEVIADAKAELSKERPNSAKLGGLLSGVSTVIGTVADMKPAYENFKTVVATTLGLLLS